MEKVTTRLLVHINDSFIHIRVYKNQRRKAGVKVELRYRQQENWNNNNNNNNQEEVKYWFYHLLM